MPKKTVENSTDSDSVRKYRALNGISHDPTNKTWAVGDLLADGDLPAQTIKDLLKSNDLEEVGE